MVKINTYRISVTNRSGSEQTLNYFNGETDFLNTVLNYCRYIFQNRRDYADNSGNFRTFSLGARPVHVGEDRYIYGYFDSGYTGEIVDIKGRDNNIHYQVSPEELISRKFFFLIKVPKGSKYAYLVVQRKANHGIKTILQTSFSHYLRLLGLMDYKIHIEDAPSYYLLETMLERGRLKEVKLIENRMMASFQNHFENTGTLIPGSTDQVLKFGNNADTILFKRELFGLYRNNYQLDDAITISDKEFDEISFTMELGNLTKTFYVKDKSKIRSNIDVTEFVDFVNGEPTTESMIDISLDIIRRLIRRPDDNLDNNAA